MQTNKENIIVDLTFEFSKEIIHYAELLESLRKFNLANQLFRSGTSIGANTEEAVGAQTKKDFITKLSIAYKEAREAHYWLRLLRDASLLEPKLAASFLADAEELKKILAAILKTAKSSRS